MKGKRLRVAPGADPAVDANGIDRSRTFQRLFNRRRGNHAGKIAVAATFDKAKGRATKKKGGVFSRRPFS